MTREIRVVLSALFLALIGSTLRAQPLQIFPSWYSGPAVTTRSAALGDVDGDGDLDLVCGNRNQSNTLYLNEGGTFATSPAWSSGPTNDTYGVALGDVDGDGDLDLVCGNFNQSNTLYLNDGGTFGASPAWSSGPGNNTRSVALGDVDGDGDLDLVCGNESQSNTLYLNEGGTFGTSPAWSSGPGNDNRSVALGDVDGDRDLDLVCGNVGGSNTLYLNDGGIFGTTPAWSSGPTNDTYSVALGDVDGDRDLDVVCGNGLDQSNTLYLNEGGTFGTAPAWSSGPMNSTRGVALGDVDGDGDLDLVCGNGVDQSSTLYLNAGGTFGASPAWSSGPTNHTRSVALGDVDGDAYLDLVCGNGVDQSNTLYLNAGGTFGASPTWSSGPTSFTYSGALGDVDGDGDLDLVCGNENQSNTLYLNEGGTFATSPAWSSGPTNDTYGVALGDVDGDGDLDLVCGNFNQSNTLYLNDGGTFGNSPVWSSGPTNGTLSVALGDVDGDGDLDLICGNGVDQSNTMYLNEGGTFGTSPAWSSGPGNNTTSVVLGDVNGDRGLDLVCGNYNESNTLYLSEGGTFGSSPAWSSGPGNITLSVALGDVDGDGDLDLVCGNGVDQSNTMYLNEGGTFGSSPAWSSGPTNYEYSVALGDVDGDGDLDLVCGNFDQSNTLYLNKGGILGTTPAWSSGPTNTTFSVALGDVDGDGDLDLVCGNNGQSNTLYNDIRQPLYKFNPVVPTNHLPNNSAYLGFVRLADAALNLKRVLLTVIDIESDPVWIVPEYQFEGAPTWFPADIGGGGTKVGPLLTSPAGVEHRIDWDISRVPVVGRPVVLRLRTISVPRRVSIIQHVDSYRYQVGRLEPVRPEIAFGSASLIFPTMTIGDRDSLHLEVANRGNTVLTVNSIEFPSVEMRVGQQMPLTISAGERDTLRVFVEPRTETAISGSLRILSNDPITPVATVDVVTDIRALEVTTELLKQTEAVPLGEAVTVTITPLPQVHIESGYLYHRAVGADTFRDSIAFSSTRTGFVVVIPGEAVTETGLEYYVRVENGGVVVTDPPGAPDSLFVQGVQSPSSVHAIARPKSGGSELLENREVLVEVTLPTGAQFVDGMLYYRIGGGTDYQTDTLRADGSVPAGTIPAEAVGPRGVEYFVEVQTATTSLTDPPLDAANHPSSIPVTVTNLVEPESQIGGAYRLLSIPLQMRGSIAGSLTDEFGATDPTRWRLFAYDPGPTQYVELPNTDVTAFEQGRAYWLISADPHRVGTGPDRGETALTDSPFEVMLQPGWNLVGNPFNFPVTWDSFTVDTLSVADAIARTIIEPPVGYVPGVGYQFGVPVWIPFDGYWVKNLTATPVSLRIPPAEALLTRSTTSPVASTERERSRPSSDAAIAAVSQPPDPPPGLVPEALTFQYNELYPTGVLPPGEPFASSISGSASIESAALFYRAGGQDEFKSTTMIHVGSGGGQQYVVSLPADSISTRGIEYYVQVFGGVDDSLAGDLRFLRVKVRNEQFPWPLRARTYRMISIPFDMGGATILGTIGDDAGGQESDWALYGFWDEVKETYTKYDPNDPGAGNFPLRVGEGYWVVAERAATLDTGPPVGTSPSTEAPYAVPLRQGWNQIGNPFAFPVAWESVMVDTLTMARARDDTLITGLYRWLPTEENVGRYNNQETEPVGTLEPYDGYFVWAKQALTLHVPPDEALESGPLPPSPAPQASRAGTRIDTNTPNADGWMVEISATSAGATDAGNYAGIRWQGAAGRDPLDWPDAPASPGHSVSVYFPHASWGVFTGPYAGDIRDALTGSGADAGHVWRFDVAKNFSDEGAGDDVELTFSGFVDVPLDLAVHLVDRRLGHTVDLREGASYRFYQGVKETVKSEDDTRFALIIGTTGFITEQQDLLVSLPAETALHQNYPNPFNPSTIIRYELASPGPVSLRVYDVSGALVKVLEDRTRPAGRYEIGWNGDNEHGESVASGVYFYRLTATDFIQTRKMILLK